MGTGVYSVAGVVIAGRKPVVAGYGRYVHIAGTEGKMVPHSYVCGKGRTTLRR